MTAAFPAPSIAAQIAALHELVAASAACLRIIADAGLSEQLQREGDRG